MENLANTAPNETLRIDRISVKTGVATTLGLIFYFLLMRLFNLHTFLELHYLNIIVLCLGLRYAIRHIKMIHGDIKYFEGLKAGLIVTLVSVFLFNIFIAIYETMIDPPFLAFLQRRFSLGPFFSVQGTVFEVIGILTVEGLSSGFILTFMLMQYYKTEGTDKKSN